MKGASTWLHRPANHSDPCSQFQACCVEFSKHKHTSHWLVSMPSTKHTSEDEAALKMNQVFKTHKTPNTKEYTTPCVETQISEHGHVSIVSECVMCAISIYTDSDIKWSFLLNMFSCNIKLYHKIWNQWTHVFICWKVEYMQELSLERDGQTGGMLSVHIHTHTHTHTV